jgi:hypothetical protein
MMKIFLILAAFVSQGAAADTSCRSCVLDLTSRPPTASYMVIRGGSYDDMIDEVHTGNLDSCLAARHEDLRCGEISTDPSAEGIPQT